jgi:transcription antitermination factor NusG
VNFDGGGVLSYWAAARIKSNETARAVWHIERQGFDVYNPMCRPSRRSLRTVPLFPGYLFIQIENVWHRLLSTGGVIDVIRSGDRPAVVRPDEIDRMRRQEDRNGIIVLPLVRFQPGEHVRVTRDPLADRIGIYSGMSARDRVRVLFQMFEREVQIELRERDLIAV